MSTIKLKYEPSGITSGSTTQLLVTEDRKFLVVDEQGIIFDSSQGGGQVMNADFTISGSTVTTGTTTQFIAELATAIQFTDTTDNSPTEWLWDFGDGTISRVQNPVKTYTVLSTGYTVSLLAAKDGAGDYTEKSAYLEIKLPDAAYVLDSFPAQLGYSFRKLSSSYNGNCLRVRRASDNAETDIGFSGGAINISAIESFCAGTDGFITTWYNQGIASNSNMIQTTGAAQPKIVSNGTIITNDKGLPAFQIIVSTGIGLIVQNYTIGNNFFLSAAWSEAAGGQRVLDSATINALMSRSRGSNGIFMNGGIYQDIWGTDNVCQVASLSKDGNIFVRAKYNNNILIETNNNTSSWGTLKIGMGESANAKFSELLVYDSENLSNQNLINQNLIDYWTV